MKYENDESNEMTDEMCEWCGEKPSLFFATSGSYCSQKCKSRAQNHNTKE